MKKFFMGLVTGSIIFGSIGAFAASSEIKLIVNGKEIKSDIPTQVIGGRTMIPLRALAEALDAKVEWDSENRTVVVTTDDDNRTFDDNPHEDGHSRHDGSDDGPLHDLYDDHPHEDGHSRHDGSDDGPNHDADDDNGEHQSRDRDGRDD